MNEHHKHTWHEIDNPNQLVILEQHRICKAEIEPKDIIGDIVDENNQKVVIKNSLPLRAIKRITLNEYSNEIILEYGKKSSFWINSYNLETLNEIFENLCKVLNKPAPARRKMNIWDKGKKPIIAANILFIIYVAVLLTDPTPYHNTDAITSLLKAFASMNLLTLNLTFGTFILIAIIALVLKSKKEIYVRELRIR